MADHEPKAITREQYLQLTGLISLGRNYVEKENELRAAATEILGKEREDWVSDIFWAARELDEVMEISKVTIVDVPKEAKSIESLDDVIKAHLEAALEAFGGDKKKVAKALGVSVKTIYNYHHKFGWPLR